MTLIRITGDFQIDVSRLLSQPVSSDMTSLCLDFRQS